MRDLILFLLVIALVGCAAPAATPVPVPTPAPELVTSIEPLVGVWQQRSGDKGFMMVSADGEGRLSEVRADVEQRPSVITNFHFEGDQAFFTESTCPNPGAYQFEVLAGGATPTAIRLRRIKDGCTDRGLTLNVEWDRVE